MNELFEQLKGFLTDAEEAIQGLRPEDAVIAITNARYTQEEIESCLG